MQINTDALLFVELTLYYILHIYPDTFFRSLQVFENESHASVHSDKTKEGLSLFGKSYD